MCQHLKLEQEILFYYFVLMICLAVAAFGLSGHLPCGRRPSAFKADDICVASAALRLRSQLLNCDISEPSALNESFFFMSGLPEQASY